MREKGALHGRVRVVGAEQRRVVLHVLGVGGLGEEGAAHGFDPQYKRFASQALVDWIGIARELLDRDGLVQGAKPSVGMGAILLAAGQYSSLEPDGECEIANNRPGCCSGPMSARVIRASSTI